MSSDITYLVVVTLGPVTPPHDVTVLDPELLELDDPHPPSTSAAPPIKAATPIENLMV
jgi:hypothetical protein